MYTVGLVFKTLGIGVLAAVVSTAAIAQSGAGNSIADLPELKVQRTGPVTQAMVCEEFNQILEARAKELEFREIDGIGKEGAAAVDSSTQQLVQASLLQSNLMLMQANKCPMPRNPIDPRLYFHSAFNCVHFVPKPNSMEVAPCDRKKWVKSYD
jgi:hypothetical protein